VFRVSLALAVLGLSAWPSSAQAARDQVASTRKPTAEASSPIDAWMKCTECTEQDLNAVVKLGPSAVPRLGQILRDGPPASARQAMQNRLLADYRNLKEFEKSHPQSKVPVTEQEYVKTYMDNFDVRYRVRSATALSRIGGAEARTYLEEAQRAPLRADVKRAVGEELERTSGSKR